MTNQNNAAQAIQEAERIAAADEYFKARTWLMDTTDNRRIFEAGFDRAYALLSKLRAPVADERVQGRLARKVELLEQVAHYADLCCAFLRDGGYAGKADALASRIKAVIDLDGQISSAVADERATESHFEDELERAYWEMDARIKGLGQHKGRPQPDRDAFKWAVRGMRPMPPKPVPERICICCNVPRNNCDCEPEAAALASAPVAVDRQRLRDLVDVVWNEATESTAVPDTPWADRMIDKVFSSLPASAPVADTYVEALECSACGHVGINDSSDTLAACKNCDWSGASPKEDHCPGCAQDGTMTAACPNCGGQYSLLAGRTIRAAVLADRQQRAARTDTDKKEM
ncbi:hypothetical protein ACXIUT_15280 [Achromobacter denitrificans]